MIWMQTSLMNSETNCRPVYLISIKLFIKQKNMPYFELYYDFILSGTLGLLVRWIDSEFEMSTHDLAVLTQSFIRNGLTNIIE